MDHIKDFVHILFENITLCEDVESAKEEMYDSINEIKDELVLEGYAKEEATKLAIERFGNLDELRKDLEETYGVKWENKAIDYMVHLLKGTLPDDELERLINQSKTNQNHAIDAIQNIQDIKRFALKLQCEKVETIAAIILSLKPSQAAEALSVFSSELFISVSKEIASGDTKKFVHIVNNMSKSTEKIVFDYLKENEFSLYKKVTNQMFLFEDIIKLDAYSLQKVLGHFPDNDLLAMSLRTVNEEIKMRILDSLSEGRKRILIDADESLGMVKLRDVEEAQSKLLSLVKQLERNGEIIINRGDADIIL